MAKQEAALSRSALANRAEQRRLQQQKQQKQQLLIVGVVGLIVAAIFVVLILLVMQSNSTLPPAAVGNYAQLQQTMTEDGLPILGDPNAKVVVAEFADFSCPHCRDYHPTIQQLIEKLVKTGQIRMMFVPQAFLAGNYSITAAKAALCAQRQYTPRQAGFWDMQDVLFNIQGTQTYTGFTTKNIADAAATAGLNLNAQSLGDCITGSDMNGILQRSSDLFNKYKLQGTPTMMYSTDGGQTFQFFTDSTGQPIAEGGPTYDILLANLNTLGVG
ncbi:MAG TPA: thioredoxin domain-containing protein [Aggregatilineales bacterium]|nr:thioredoxin domain-containing protein [Aggregatilineales bacterium]